MAKKTSPWQDFEFAANDPLASEHQDIVAWVHRSTPSSIGRNNTIALFSDLESNGFFILIDNKQAESLEQEFAITPTAITVNRLTPSRSRPRCAR